MTSSVEIAREIRSADRVPAAAPRDPVIATLWSRLAAYQTFLLAAILIVVLAALVLPPFVFLLKASVVDVQRGGEWSLANFEAVLGSRRFLATSVNSLVFAAGSAVLALLIGWATAWIVERTNTPLKPLAYLTAIISLGTPYILYVTAWLLLFGKAGPVNQLYRTLTGTSDVLINVYSMSGMILVEGFLWSPLAFLLVGATLRNANPELEEAARVQRRRRLDDHPARDLAARRCRRSWRWRCWCSSAPSRRSRCRRWSGCPGRISVLTTDIYSNMVAQAPPDIGGASALSVLMLAAGAGAARTSTAGCRGTPSDSPPSPARASGRGRSTSGGCATSAAAILVLNFLLLLVVPIADAGLGVAAAVLSAGQRGGARPASRLDNYRTVFCVRSGRADAQHADGRGGDRDAWRWRSPSWRHGWRCGARRAAGSSSGWRPSRWCFPASFSASR